MRRHRWHTRPGQARPGQYSEQIRAGLCHSDLQSPVRPCQPQSQAWCHCHGVIVMVSLWLGNIIREDITPSRHQSHQVGQFHSSREGREKLITFITATAPPLKPDTLAQSDNQINTKSSQLKFSLEFARTEIPVLSKFIFVC